jgi:hypothetical protein
VDTDDAGRDGEHIEAACGQGACDDGFLNMALTRLSAVEGMRADRAVDVLRRDVRQTVYRRLAERGLVRQHESELFGMTVRTTWPAAERTAVIASS